MALLGFADELAHSGLLQFWKLKSHDIPPLPGAYVLIARGRHHFKYPNGRSPVYYIGQSKNLRRRLYIHVEYAAQAKNARKQHLYWPRYEFAAAFGGRYCYFRTWQGLKPKSLEELLLAKFAKRYRSFPIANGSGSWKRVAAEIGEF